jgi:hypothetical protein
MQILASRGEGEAAAVRYAASADTYAQALSTLQAQGPRWKFSDRCEVRFLFHPFNPSVTKNDAGYVPMNKDNRSNMPKQSRKKSWKLNRTLNIEHQNQMSNIEPCHMFGIALLCCGGPWYCQ